SFSPSGFECAGDPLDLRSFPTRRSSDLGIIFSVTSLILAGCGGNGATEYALQIDPSQYTGREVPVHAEVTLRGNLQNTPVEELRSEEHTSELQSRENLVCRLLLEKKKTI